MKSRLFVLFVAAASAFMLQSCEDTSILDVTQTLTYSYEVQVVGVDTVFTNTQVVDLAAEDSIIAEYGSKIKEINVQEVKYWLTTFEGADDQSIIEATLKVADQNGGTVQTISTITNQNLKALLDTPTVLTVNQDAINSLQDYIKNAPHKFQLAFNSACNKGPLNFTVKFEITFEMVANPL